ncbi:MAG: PhoX family phosphatase [Planctomycetota bacterium]
MQHLDKSSNSEPIKTSNTFESIVKAQISRRNLLKKAGASAFFATLPLSLSSADEKLEKKRSSLKFKEILHGNDPQLHVPEEYEVQVLLRWGDKLFPHSPDFDPHHQTAEAQASQFGVNNDFIGFFPLPFGSQNSDHGILTVNHEYTRSVDMYPGSPNPDQLSKEFMDVDIVSLGLSIAEIQRVHGKWEVILESPYNRRITPYTEMKITGPVAGNPRLITTTSPDGIQTHGTYANCAGGVTPWGTLLTAEENFQDFFYGDPSNTSEANNHKRYGVTGINPLQGWGYHYDRWNVSKEPHEPLHMGWIVEIDPYDPTSIPQKRTALGRFRHEGAGIWINSDNHVVVYMGDDQKFEYIYRFVSQDKYQTQDREQNKNLLSEGTLSVAEFTAENQLIWHPLVYGFGPLNPQQGFYSQADVLLNTRKAADLLGATKMDRPEDIEVNPITGHIFVILTKNDERLHSNLNSANPRHHNLFGHILELKPPQGNHTQDIFSWDFFILAGNPHEKLHGALYHPHISEQGWFIAPDNAVFDAQGRLWIATDGANEYGLADGIWVCDVEGEGRALTKHFLRAPCGAEVTGPYFTPENTSFFCSIQHPGEGEHSSFEKSLTLWPDFQEGNPPRPSVVVIQKKDGKVIGS